MLTMLRSLRATALAVCLLGIAASLSAQTPAAPSDKLAWNQSVSSGSSPSYSFAILVDGTRAALQNVTCAGDTDLACSAPLPAMTPGRHVVQVVAVFASGSVTAESAPSADLVVTMVVIATPTNLRLVK